MHIVFSHGKESGPWGRKIEALAKTAQLAGWHVTSVNYQGIESAQERVERLVEHCKEISGAIFLVGSSMGGYVTLRAFEELEGRGIIGMFLMAPALEYDGRRVKTPNCPLEIVHGFYDDVLPYEGSIEFVKASEYAPLLYLVNDDHRLHRHIPLLSKCLKQAVYAALHGVLT